MAVNHGSSCDVPSVSRDFYLAGSNSIATGFRSSRKQFLTREEKFLRVQKNFPKVFKEEWGMDLPVDAEGLVIIQQGHYPLDMDITINPNLGHHCAKQALSNPTKIMRQPYVFASRTYWLSAGKLECLLDSSSVLVLSRCTQAVVRYMALKKEDFEPLYMGTHFCKVRNFEHPYRVWRLQREDLSVVYLLVSLLNGGMFELEPQDLPEMCEVPKKFVVGVVCFEAESNGDYIRD